MKILPTSFTAGLFAVCAATLLIAPVDANAARCETLKGEMVGFGETWTRETAEDKLTMAITEWETKTGKKASPRDRSVDCKVYIEFLNEFECTAEAVVCR